MSTKSFIDIDKYALDEEWVSQPKRFRRFSKMLAECKKKVAMAKAALSLADAEISVDIKTNPNAYGMAKAPSDAVVKNLVIMDKRHRKAQQALIDAEYEEDQVQADVSALAQRKSALQDLVILQVQDYFAEPKVKTTDSEINKKVAAQKVKEHLERNKTKKKKED